MMIPWYWLPVGVFIGAIVAVMICAWIVASRNP